MKRVVVHTAADGAYAALEKLQSVGALRFPERRGGPDSCVRELLAAMKRSDAVLVITAYADIINFLGAAVEAKLVDSCVHLHHADGSVTSHDFNVEGWLEDWPFGVLMGDYDTALHELKTIS